MSLKTSPIITQLPIIERALKDQRFPAMSQWWVEVFTRFYISGRRQLVLRCGRRAGKSTSLCRIAVLEALLGNHLIPPGDVGIVGIVSVSKSEADSRLRTIKAILDALNIQYKPIPDGIELLSKPIAFKTFAATIRGVVGGTWICAVLDEVSRWRDSDTGANPATEVLGSLRPTLATMPNAKIFMSSSPLGKLDAHYDAFELGENDFQCVASGASWECNPTITEDDCHGLEPSKTLFDREYRAIPSDSITNALDLEQYDTCVIDANELRNWSLNSQPFLVLDSSSGRGDSWTWAIAGHGFRREPHCPRVKTIYDDVTGLEPIDQIIIQPPPSRRLLIGNFHQIKGKFGQQIDFDSIVTQMVITAQSAGCRLAFGDQFNSFALSGAFSRHRVQFTSIPWTQQSKTDAMATVRRWFRDQTIAIEPGNLASELRSEIGSLEEKILPSGGSSFGARRGAHDDLAALIIGAAMVEQADQGRGSPLGMQRTKHIILHEEYEGNRDPA